MHKSKITKQDLIEFREVIEEGFSKLEVAISRENYKITQNTYKHIFTNGTGKDVDDLHIKLTKPDIRVLDLGPFRQSQAKEVGKGGKKHTEIDIGGDDIANNGTAGVTLQSDKHQDFTIDKWYWTSGGTRVGSINDGNPLEPQ